MPNKLQLEAIIRPNILLLKRHVPSTSSVMRGRPRVRLDANENSFGSCLVAQDGLDESTLRFSESLGLHRYPSPSMGQLKQQIVSTMGFPVSHVQMLTLGAGTADLIDLLIRMTCVPSRDAILLTPPTFELYRWRAEVNDVGVVESKLRFDDGDFHLHVPEVLDMLAEKHNIKLVFLVSPGNPTGTLVPLQQIREILKFLDRGLVVVDEAYIDFAPEPSSASALGLLDEFPNLVVLRSLSKSHGLAGARLGFALAHPSITEMMHRVQLPFAMSSWTSALAMLALSPASQRAHRAGVAAIAEGRARLMAALQGPEFAMTDVGPPIGGSAANFVVLPVWARRTDGAARARDSARAAWACEVLRSEFDTAVRCLVDDGCDGCIRITVGTVEENEKLLRDMAAVFGRG